MPFQPQYRHTPHPSSPPLCPLAAVCQTQTEEGYGGGGGWAVRPLAHAMDHSTSNRKHKVGTGRWSHGHSSTALGSSPLTFPPALSSPSLAADSAALPTAPGCLACTAFMTRLPRWTSTSPPEASWKGRNPSASVPKAKAQGRTRSGALREETGCWRAQAVHGGSPLQVRKPDTLQCTLSRCSCPPKGHAITGHGTGAHAHKGPCHLASSTTLSQPSRLLWMNLGLGGRAPSSTPRHRSSQAVITTSA